MGMPIRVDVAGVMLRSVSRLVYFESFAKQGVDMRFLEMNGEEVQSREMLCIYISSVDKCIRLCLQSDILVRMSA